MDICMSTHLEERWKTIVAAGGPEAFITQALKKKGVYREYRPDIMSIKNEQEKNKTIRYQVGILFLVQTDHEKK